MSKGHLLFFIAVFAAPILVALVRMRSRRLCGPEQILDHLRQLPCSVSDDSEMWSLERDARFWDEIGGVRGLMRLRRKAVYLRDLVTSLNIAPEDRDDFEFISQRCYWIIALVLFQAILAPFSTPHFFGRWAAGLYSEVRTRTLTLCRAYRRELYLDLRAFA